MLKERVQDEATLYPSIITRHITERLQCFPSSQVEHVLDGSGLEFVAGQVRSKDGTPVNRESAYRYKLAIKNVLGAGPYSMTKVNFTLAGCQCKDCLAGVK